MFDIVANSWYSLQNVIYVLAYNNLVTVTTSLKEVYVLLSVCLSVFLSARLLVKLDKKELIKFWKAYASGSVSMRNCFNWKKKLSSFNIARWHFSTLWLKSLEKLNGASWKFQHRLYFGQRSRTLPDSGSGRRDLLVWRSAFSECSRLWWNNEHSSTRNTDNATSSLSKNVKIRTPYTKTKRSLH